MIDAAYVATMARYNAWQNRSLVAAADGLGDEARRADRGAFFKSIHGTFSHLLWADEMWLSRLIGSSRPAGAGRNSADYVEDWDEFRRRRAKTHETIIGWAGRVDSAELAGDMTWLSGLAGKEVTRPRGLIVAHVFNHQTHHRGQIHAMLTAAGAAPDDTDLMLVFER